MDKIKEFWAGLSRSKRIFVVAFVVILLLAIADNARAFEGCKSAVDADQHLRDSGEVIVATGVFNGVRHFLVQRPDGTFYDTYMIPSPTEPMVCSGEDFGLADPRKPQSGA